MKAQAFPPPPLAEGDEPPDQPGGGDGGGAGGRAALDFVCLHESAAVPRYHCPTGHDGGCPRRTLRGAFLGWPSDC